MKKTVGFLIILMLFSFVACSVKSKNTEQTYDESYEEVEHEIVDIYGDVVIVDVLEDKDHTYMYLYLKEDYKSYIQNGASIPSYQIMEDVRVLVNHYLDKNPDSKLALGIEKTHIIMLIWDGYHYISLYGIDTSEKRFNRYVLTESIYLKEGKSEFWNELNYISKSGEDIKEYYFCYDSTLTEEEIITGVNKTVDKFPQLETFIIHNSNSNEMSSVKLNDKIRTELDGLELVFD